MHVMLIDITIDPAYRDEFIEATRINHEASVQEPGNRRFDLLEDPDDPARFVLYEWYEHETQAAAHRETEHFFRWRDTVEKMMARPRDRRVLRGVFPR